MPRQRLRWIRQRRLCCPYCDRRVEYLVKNDTIYGERCSYGCFSQRWADVPGVRSVKR